MKNESPQGFSRPNTIELVCVYAESELKKARIDLQQLEINRDGNTITVTTDKKMPEENISNIRQYAEYKGVKVEFLTSG